MIKKKEGCEIDAPPPATVYGWMDDGTDYGLMNSEWAAGCESSARVDQSQRRGHYWTPPLCYSQC